MTMKEKKALTQMRNMLVIKLLWIFYIIDTIVYTVIDTQTDYISPFAALIFLFPITFFVYQKKSPFVMMYMIFVSYYSYLTYMLIKEPAFVNFMFLLLGIMLAVVYQQSSIVAASSFFSISLLIYFFETKFLQLQESLTRQDLVYFILFGAFVTAILLYYTKILNEFWHAAKLKAAQTEEELHSTQEYLQSFFIFNNDAIAVFDLNGYIITVNPAFERIYGWRKDEIIGQPIPFIPSHLREAAWERFKKAQQGEQIIGFETQDLCKNGRIIDVEITISPLYDSEGNVVALSEISRDITEKKATEEIIRQTDKLSLAGEMAAGVAHEIRNPLTSLNGFIQLIHEDSDKYHAYTSIMMSELTRLNAIIEEFLMLAKPHSLAFQTDSLQNILHEVILLFESECLLKNVVIHPTISTEPAIILCDRNQLKQVFINLLKNALEAMPEGGSLSIQTISKNGHSVEISITDTGEGIPASILEHINKPFFTTKKTGTGLGLAVTGKIVQQHKGTLSITSNPGEGTTVSLLLPLFLHNDPQGDV
jgi:PAS domain S-box-containing protein